jgi:F0F1-type ATP synthase assembly protein I
MNQRKSSSVSEAYRVAGPYLTLGIQFAATLLICVLIGKWVDGYYDTTPAFTLVGGILGIVAGFYHFLKTVVRLQKMPEDKES